MHKNGLTLFVITLSIILLSMFFYNLGFAQGLTPVVQGERFQVVSGKQHGIRYEIYRGNSLDHYVVRFFKDEKDVLNSRITDLEVSLEIENGQLLSVAPAGTIEDNKSHYKFSSRRGLNTQLEDKGLFLIFKFQTQEDSKGTLNFSFTEYTQISKTSATKKSEPISFGFK